MRTDFAMLKIVCDGVRPLIKITKQLIKVRLQPGRSAQFSIQLRLALDAREHDAVAPIAGHQGQGVLVVGQHEVAGEVGHRAMITSFFFDLDRRIADEGLGTIHHLVLILPADANLLDHDNQRPERP